MSDARFTVTSMIGPLRLHDVTVTVDRDDGCLPNPAEFAVAAQQAASARTASIVSTHTTEQIISVITAHAADWPAAVAIALAVVSEAFRCLAAPVVDRLDSWD